jgi:hypothetical protein
MQVVGHVLARHNIVCLYYKIEIGGWIKGNAHRKVMNHIVLKRSKGEMNITMGQETRIDQREEKLKIIKANNT